MMYNFWLNELHQEKEIVNDISFLKLLLWTRTPATTAQKCTNNTPSFIVNITIVILCYSPTAQTPAVSDGSIGH